MWYPHFKGLSHHPHCPKILTKAPHPPSLGPFWESSEKPLHTCPEQGARSLSVFLCLRLPFFLPSVRSFLLLVVVFSVCLAFSPSSFLFLHLSVFLSLSAFASLASLSKQRKQLQKWDIEIQMANKVWVGDLYSTGMLQPLYYVTTLPPRT